MAAFSESGSSSEKRTQEMHKQELTLDGISLLISRETPKDPPQYYVRKYPDPFNTTEAPTEKCITNFPHPYEKLRDLQKVALTSLQLARVAHLKLQLPTPIRRANNEIVQYVREDGTPLTATLYTPPGYDSKTDGKRPVEYSFPIGLNRMKVRNR
eukprot:9225805-Pyramimonas_sp.AAC.1